MDKIAEQYLEIGRLIGAGIEQQLAERGILQKEAFSAEELRGNTSRAKMPGDRYLPVHTQGGRQEHRAGNAARQVRTAAGRLGSRIAGAAKKNPVAAAGVAAGSAAAIGGGAYALNKKASYGRLMGYVGLDESNRFADSIA